MQWLSYAQRWAGSVPTVSACCGVLCVAISGATKPKRDVVELVKSMNIQFDNLCQVKIAVRRCICCWVQQHLHKHAVS